jgi:hypothetical protein
VIAQCADTIAPVPPWPRGRPLPLMPSPLVGGYVLDSAKCSLCQVTRLVGPESTATAGAPEFEIVCVRAGRSRPETVSFELSDNVLDGAPHFAESFQDLFSDNWLYTEDDATMEFEVKKINGR